MEKPLFEPGDRVVLIASIDTIRNGLDYFIGQPKFADKLGTGWKGYSFEIHSPGEECQHQQSGVKKIFWYQLRPVDTEGNKIKNSFLLYAVEHWLAPYGKSKPAAEDTERFWDEGPYNTLENEAACLLRCKKKLDDNLRSLFS